MKTRWFMVILLLGGILFLASGCNPRVDDTPVPTPVVVPTASGTQPVVGPVKPTPATTAAPTPDLLSRPQMTVQGELVANVPYGITADGHYFKGDPQAPVIMYEFSDFQ